MAVHVTLFLILLTLGLLQSAYRAYQKKKAQLDAQQAERQRQQAILRTGRDPLAEQAAAAQRQAQRQQQADVMAERQEALRRLREQQANAGTPQVPQQSAGGSGGPITRELWPGGPVIVIGGADSPRPQQQRPVQQTRPVQPPQRAKPVQQPARVKQKAQRQQQTQAPRSSREDRHDEGYYQRERTIARMQATDPSDPKPAPPPAPVFVRPTTAQQWRAAFIASEVFGTPVSMRGPANH